MIRTLQLHRKSPETMTAYVAAVADLARFLTHVLPWMEDDWRSLPRIARMGTIDRIISVVRFVAIRDIRGQFTTENASECLSGLPLPIERAGDDRPECFRVLSPVAFGILRRTSGCT